MENQLSSDRNKYTEKNNCLINDPDSKFTREVYNKSSDCEIAALDKNISEILEDGCKQFKAFCKLQHSHSFRRLQMQK